MNDETQETTVLEDHQIKLLLEDIEKAYVPRQDINFLSLCNQQQRVYGLPGSSVSKLKRNQTKPNQTKQYLLCFLFILYVSNILTQCLLLAETSVPVQVC